LIRYDCRMQPATPARADLEALFSDFDPSRYPLIAHSTQGIIVRVSHQNVDLAVKFPTGRGLTRRLFTAALRREHRAYRRLADVEGFARCFGLFQRRYLALEYLQAQPLKQAAPPDRDRYFGRLLQVIENMHRRGVAHGDLKSRHNVMVSADGNPVIIDLGTAVVRRDGWHPLNRRIFRYMCRIDRNSWIKLKYGGYDQVDEADRHLLDRTLIERINSRIRRH
jgi:serine/threonine protein kinase